VACDGREGARHAGVGQASPAHRTVDLPGARDEAGTGTPSLAAAAPALDLHGPTLDLLPAHAAVLDGQGIVRFTNRAWDEFGRGNGLAAPEGGRGLSYLAACEAATGEDADVARAVALGLRQVLAGERASFDHGRYPCHAPGRERWFTLQARGLPGGGALVLHHDVTDLHLALRRAEHRALHDPLTGLPNRLLLLDRLGQALRRADRAGDGAGLLAVDLDGFKRVNDRHGHPVGDGFLRLVGQRMVSALRRADTVARWSGDEFVAILPDLAGVGDAVARGGRLVAACQRPAAVERVILRPRLSVGLAVFPEHGRGAGALLAAADRAMYRAKAAGGGRLALAEPAGGARAGGRTTSRGLNGPDASFPHRRAAAVPDPNQHRERPDRLSQARHACRRCSPAPRAVASPRTRVRHPPWLHPCSRRPSTCVAKRNRRRRTRRTPHRATTVAGRRRWRPTASRASPAAWPSWRSPPCRSPPCGA
jgi:diguanylate cyclase (GGDEF)-like protein